MVKGKNADKMDLKFCEYLNISACPASESGNVIHSLNIFLNWLVSVFSFFSQFNLVVYNPLARVYKWYLRFPVNTMDILIQAPDGGEIPVEVSYECI